VGGGGEGGEGGDIQEVMLLLHCHTNFSCCVNLCGFKVLSQTTYP
jgi:hypothetical protein